MLQIVFALLMGKIYSGELLEPIVCTMYRASKNEFSTSYLFEVFLHILNYPTLILNEFGHPWEFEQIINLIWV